MTSVADITQWMESIAPLALSEEWDNTGLLLGDPSAHVHRVMTCLSLTREVVEEAVQQQAGLVITHHPLPFRPMRRITTETLPGRLLWRLASAGIGIYSAHTAWDSAAGGINEQLASQLAVVDPRPLTPAVDSTCAGLGAGRYGELSEPCTVNQLSQRLSRAISDCRPRGVDCGRPVRRVAIACGSGGSLLPAAIARGCDLFLTGEATFHHCLEAQAHEMSLLMVGHFASERFSMVQLAENLSTAVPGIVAWAAKSETDPVRNLTP